MRTKGFCSALLRCGEIKFIAEKREQYVTGGRTDKRRLKIQTSLIRSPVTYAISDLIANIARTKRRRTKSFGINAI